MILSAELMKRNKIVISLLLVALCAIAFAGCKKSNSSSEAHSSSSKTKQVDEVIINDSSESGVIVDFNTGSVVSTEGKKSTGSSSKNSDSSSKPSDNKSQPSSESSNTSNTSNTSSNASSSGAPSEASDVSEPTTMDGYTPWE